MKKFSLSNLSKQSLDKLQKSAIRGGAGSCICAYICNSCSCIIYEGDDLLSTIYDAEMYVWVDELADRVLGS